MGLTSSRQAVDAAKKASREIDDLKEKHTFMSEADKVCGICGVRCNPNMESDFQAHLDGRLHEGYVKIRAKVKEMRGKVSGGQKIKSDSDEKRSKADGDEKKSKADEKKNKANGDERKS